MSGKQTSNSCSWDFDIHSYLFSQELCLSSHYLCSCRMVLVRLSTCEEEGKFIRGHFMKAFWEDVKKRSSKVGVSILFLLLSLAQNMWSQYVSKYFFSHYSIFPFSHIFFPHLCVYFFVPTPVIVIFLYLTF